MAYRRDDGSIDRDALALDAKLYHSLFEIIDRAEQLAVGSAVAAHDPTVAACFGRLKVSLRNAQFVHLTDGVRLIIDAADDEAFSCKD